MTTETITTPPGSPFIRGVKALADYLGVSEKTVQRDMRSHRLPFIRLGNVLLFRRSEIEQTLSALTIPSVSMVKRNAKRGVL